MQASRWFGLAARVAFGVFAAAALWSCSGAVSGPAVSTGAVVVSPSTAVLYSELPTTFTVTGGNGTYIITSSDQNVLPVAGTTTDHTFYVIPNDVGSDTPVTLTVRDTAGSAFSTASLTVKPRTIANAVTITPSGGQAASCGTGLCSGGDAEVKVVLSQLGVPLVGRTVQFDVASGDFKIISSTFAGTEVLSTTATAITDSTGTARIRIRANSDALAQTALLRVTDLSSGFTQTAALQISSALGALSVLPGAISFTGTSTTTCATGVSADVIVVGGRPPYQITKPAGFNVNPTTLTTSGGRITITSTGQCARTGNALTPDGGQTVGIIDSNGVTASVVVHNDPAPVSAITSAFTVAPTSVTLGCGQTANVALVGGSGFYYAASGNIGLVTATIAQPNSAGAYLGVITRASSSTATSPTTVDVAFSDGQSVKTVSVSLPICGSGSGGGSSIVASPSSVTLTDCTTNASFNVTGGNVSSGGQYQVVQNGFSISYTRTGNTAPSETFFVRRSIGSSAPTTQQSLVITDGVQQTTVPVNVSGAGAGQC